MNKILNDLKKQQQSANASANASSLSFAQTAAENSQVSPSNVPSAAANVTENVEESEGEVIQNAEPEDDVLPSATEAPPNASIAANAETQATAPSQFDLSSANIQSQALESLDLSISASQDCF
jgi:hypothetical protein